MPSFIPFPLWHSQRSTWSSNHCDACLTDELRCINVHETLTNVSKVQVHMEAWLGQLYQKMSIKVSLLRAVWGFVPKTLCS